MANKNLFTKFASLAMAGALAFSAVPVAGLNGVFEAEAAGFASYTTGTTSFTWNPSGHIKAKDIVSSLTIASGSNSVEVKTDSNVKYQASYDGKLLGTAATYDDFDMALTTVGDYKMIASSGTNITQEINFKVTKRDLSKATLTLETPSDIYNGQYQSSDIATNPVIWTDGDKDWEKNIGNAGLLNTSSEFYYNKAGGTKVGKYTGTLTATEKNLSGSVSANYEIKKYTLDDEKKTTNENDTTFGKVYVKTDTAAYANGSNVSSHSTVKAVLKQDDGTYKLTTLKEGEDYTVTYSGTQKGTGAGTAVIKGTGNFDGVITDKYDIVDADKNIASCEITMKNGTTVVENGETLTYTGNVIKVDQSELKYTDSKGVTTQLTKDTDYTISYEYADDKNDATKASVGVVTVKYTGINKWAGTVTRSFVIGPKSIKGNEITATISETPVFNGKAKTPTVTVSDSGKPLYSGQSGQKDDFVVTYDSNVNAGKAIANVVGVGNYKDARSVEFEITAMNMSDVTVEEIANQVYTGSAVEPVVSAKYTNGDNEEVAMELNSDFTVEYANNIEVGTATVTVEGAGNFTGSKSASFMIKSADSDLSKAEVVLTQDSVPYDGKYHTAGVKSVKMVGADGKVKVLGNGTDYSVSAPTVKEVGTYDVVVKAKGDTYGGSITVPFEITGYDVNDAGFSLKKSSVKYNGKNQKPELVVAEGTRYDGKDMVEGTDYEVSGIKNIKNVGKLTVKVTGIGAYAGTEKSFTFKVTKADQPMKVSTKTASVKASKVAKKNQTIKASKVFSVSKNEGSVSYKKTSGNSKIKVASNGKITVKKGLKKGTYKIKVKVTAKGNSNYNSGNKTVKATIKVK